MCNKDQAPSAANVNDLCEHREHPGHIAADCLLSTSAAFLQSFSCCRHPLLDVVHDLVKPELIEELGQLLVLVAKEEADKQHQLHQQPSQVQQQEQLEPLAADGHAAVTASTVLKQELTQAAATEAAELQADSDLQETAAKRARSISPSGVGVVEQKTAVVKLEPAADADGDSPMHETVPLNEPKQSIELEQGPVADAGSPAADSEESVSEAYAAQEAVVLQEFNAILQRIVAQAEKKSSSLAAAAAAPGPAGQAQLVTAASTASTDASDLQAQQQRQHQLAQAPQQLQQQLAQQQVQQSQPMVSCVVRRDASITRCIHPSLQPLSAGPRLTVSESAVMRLYV